MKSGLLYAYDHIYPVIMKCKYFLKIKYCAKTYVLKLCFISMTSLHISFHLQKQKRLFQRYPATTLYIMMELYKLISILIKRQLRAMGKLLCILIIQLILKVSNNNQVWRYNISKSKEDLRFKQFLFLNRTLHHTFIVIRRIKQLSNDD